MSRGRLIFPITAEIARLDLSGMAGDPDAGGPLTAGYDPDFREPVLLPSSDRLGAVNRKEIVVQVPAQVDEDGGGREDLERLQMLGGGDVKTGLMVLVFHFADLEALGLVDGTSGRALIKEGDRLSALYRPSGELIQTFPSPPGLYARDASPIGIGFDGQRNLLKVIFQSRDRSATAAG